MGVYTYDFSNTVDQLRLDKDLKKAHKLLTSRKFNEFIAKKCLEEVADICNYTLVEYMEHSVFEAKVSEYMRNHKYELEGDYIWIYNDTAYTQEELYWLSPKAILNYANGISVAKIIEYGTGVGGTSQDDWQTNIGDHNGTNSTYTWWYKNPDTGKGTITSGHEGYFIYQKLLDRVEEKFETWMVEFLKKEETLWT